ncbi:DNA cytosine methyltransferase [Mycoplasma nasistruthionis]|uniref:DNA (cytosine-5-)-methyltransferase n=1 Tax=Mycoplasma nasistruthionis TaxID=353852 RepID=A0A4Y6I6H3_9MOLU|nr:DNA cytosine methyltransferase [Mycoplasma nasistruthionis]QDF64799.1 DNA cytosine methyltransferase [Mycoplasma nasistruthionis]
MKLKIASFFAGVGGIDLGFKDLGTVIYANEYNKNAATTFESNFDLKVDVRDIRQVSSSEIPDFDIMLAGFPCQAFSIAGYRQGFDDLKGRGNLFFELERIFIDKQPQIIFLENVKNLVSHDNGNTFKVIVEKLRAQNYHVAYKVLNSMTYGNLPQNRERIYIVAFKDKNVFDQFEFPNQIKLTKSIKDIVDFDNELDDKFYYTNSNFKHFDVLKGSMTNTDTIYQWRRQYVRENKSKVCPTLTANMGTGGHNVPLVLTKFGIRKLTPKECFMFQGYPKDFVLPNLANSHLYKQAGNSVAVSVIARIAENIKLALNKGNGSKSK